MVRRSGVQSVFQFIPKVFSGVEVRALCRTLEFFHSNLHTPCLHGARFVLRGIVMLEQLTQADAIAVDGGEVYIAGKCGLVPVMVEQYDERETSSYYAVAVVRKNSDLTYILLRGKKSCHTGVGHTAGWNIPMGLLHTKYKHCNFSTYFSESCAPGSDPESSLCRICKGGEAGKDKCKASDDEPYYGFAGAFRYDSHHIIVALYICMQKFG
ncbi:hypothetical protein PGIGA_G00130010 [Pangasianodon gigas]|uniref:Uncharacterized protein n=1 Tax=Pangasianodon gigas TaxID=30993 RepID=A0ACC5XIA0_PANGG|nr:hypothetical protein [Pangasianodon gigas]